MLNDVLYIEQIFDVKRLIYDPTLFRWHTVENFVVVCTGGNEDGAEEEEKERVQ